jgi:crotonobetainyl-CoA:carnitine CoA-transferase CaiB-like acyl-CoA transferase
MKLEGIRVIDLSLFLPGPHLAMMMADHGAEVIKIEPPGEGDPARHIGAMQGETSVLFRNANRHKKSIVLNLKHAAAQEVLMTLLASADVLIEAFRPGVAERLGFGYTKVAERNPAIVYCSISAFGQYGPYRDVPAHNLAIEALAGSLSINLGNDDEPALPGVPAADMASSLTALSGILMALLRRQRTGRGDHLDISMHDALLAWLPNAVGAVFAHKRAPTPKHERLWGGSAFYRIYRTSDGRHVVLGAQELKFVRTLLQELGRLDFLPLCEPGPGTHQAPLIEFLSGLFASRTRAQWIDWFADKDLSFAPVNNLREAFDDLHAQARCMRVEDASGHEHIGIPIKFAVEPGRAHLQVPQFGEHTDEILRSLGYEAAAIEQLLRSGAVVRGGASAPIA